jgi:hypothetical protein
MARPSAARPSTSASPSSCSKGRIAYYFRSRSDVFFGIQRQALVWALESVGPDVVDAQYSAGDRLYTMVWRRVMHTLVHREFMSLAQQDIDRTLADEGRPGSTVGEEIQEMRTQVELGFRRGRQRRHAGR